MDGQWNWLLGRRNTHIDGVHWRGTQEAITVQTTGQFPSREPHVWAVLCIDKMILRCEIAGFGFMKAEELFLSSRWYPRDEYTKLQYCGVSRRTSCSFHCLNADDIRGRGWKMLLLHL